MLFDISEVLAHIIYHAPSKILVAMLLARSQAHLVALVDHFFPVLMPTLSLNRDAFLRLVRRNFRLCDLAGLDLVGRLGFLIYK